MATVQNVMLRIAQRIAPTARTGQIIQDLSSAVTITGAADNGAGLIRITAAGHGFQTNDQVFIKAVTGTTEANNTLANPYWVVTYVSSSTFDLQGSTFSNVYSADGTATGALVGSVPAGSFTAQLILDIYNHTRALLAHVLFAKYPASIAAQKIGGLSVRNAALTFTSGVATKPTGYVKGFSLTDSSNGRISIVTASDYELLRELESATNKFVIDLGTTFTAPSGTTYVSNGSSYILIYSGITTFTLTDVLFMSGTQTSEPLDEDWIPVIVEGAAKLAAGFGVAEVQGIIEGMVERVGA